MRRKSDLPTKICATCGLPFAWRKKWARDWETVRFCSERCRREKLSVGRVQEAAPTAAARRIYRDDLGIAYVPTFGLVVTTSR